MMNGLSSIMYAYVKCLRDQLAHDIYSKSTMASIYVYSTKDLLEDISAAKL